MQARLHEVALGGYDLAVMAARASLPVLHRRLLELGVVTSREALSLVQQLGIVTLPDLELALDDGPLKQVADKGLDERLRPAAAALDIEARRLTLGRAADITEQVLAAVARCCPAIDLLTAAGDVRRFESLVSAIVIVGRATDPAAAIDAVSQMPGVDDVRHRGSRRAIVAMQQVEVDIRVAAPDDYGTVLFNATGSRAHLRAVHDRRHQRPRLSPGEEALYAHAGLPFIAPELRENAGEIEAAARRHASRARPARAHSRRPAHAHRVQRRRRLARDDGGGMLGARLRIHRDHGPLGARGRSRTLSRGDLDDSGTTLPPFASDTRA